MPASEVRAPTLISFWVTAVPLGDLRQVADTTLLPTSSVRSPLWSMDPGTVLFQGEGPGACGYPLGFSQLGLLVLASS